jgi:penicillin-binding protein 1A
MSRRERKRQRKAHRGHPVGRVVLMTALIGVCVLIGGALLAVGWVVSVADSAPNLSQLKPRDARPPSEVFAADGELLGYIHSDTIYTQVSDSQIPKTLQHATVAIEDRRFYQHGALDYQGILRAGVKDIFGHGGSLQGASTLTMQLVDNRYLDGTKYASQHDLKYKIVQAKLAEQLEGKHSKDWILDSYLNDVPYGTVGGQTAYGVEAAAQMFFDKPVRKLNLEQAALLAGLPQAPSEYNPFIDANAARHRRNEVLQSMVNAGYISQLQADDAATRSLEVKHSTAFNVHRDPYVFDFVLQQLEQDLCPATPNHCPALQQGGMKIYTTIDLRKQALAVQAILAHEGGPGQPAAALASIDPNNGHILAIAASSSYSQTTFDYATQAHRQPGSAFKVFALMTLIHDFHGDPNSTYYTSKFLPAGWLAEDPTWSVHTAEDSYQGTISITKATILSDNTVFVQLAADLGWDKLDDTAHAMGITSPLDGNPAEVIGGLRIGVTPLEMADAYGTLANGGTHIPATIINRVVFGDGSSRDFGNPGRTTVFPYNEAYEGTSVLKQVVTSGTGTAANYGCPVAGKTGTANNLENAWFVGYTPRMSTAVWVGYPQGNIPMANGFGGTLAAPIWHDYMAAASSGYCGNWNPPTTPFQGTSFFGHFASSAPAPPSSASSASSSTATTSTTTANGGAGVSSTTSTNNSPTVSTNPPSPAHRRRPRRAGKRPRRAGQRLRPTPPATREPAGPGSRSIDRIAARDPAGSLVATARPRARALVKVVIACQRKKRSSSRARWSRLSPTRCSASSSTIWTASCSVMWPARCAASGSASCRGTGSGSSCRRTTWTGRGSCTATADAPVRPAPVHA